MKRLMIVLAALMAATTPVMAKQLYKKIFPEAWIVECHKVKAGLRSHCSIAKRFVKKDAPAIWFILSIDSTNVMRINFSSDEWWVKEDREYMVEMTFNRFKKTFTYHATGVKFKKGLDALVNNQETHYGFIELLTRDVQFHLHVNQWYLGTMTLDGSSKPFRTMLEKMKEYFGNGRNL